MRRRDTGIYTSNQYTRRDSDACSERPQLQAGSVACVKASAKNHVHGSFCDNATFAKTLKSAGVAVSSRDFDVFKSVF